jgi:hypothetical protein
MSLAGMPGSELAPTALVLNLVVTGAALLRFGLAGRLKLPLFLPFLVPAVPAAFLGGFVTAPRTLFYAILACGLAVAGVGLLRSGSAAKEKAQAPRRSLLYGVAVPAGAVIGLLSGFLGIGGGVFLGPLVLFLGWAGPKEVAAMNSALILVLSAVALAAHGVRGTVELGIVLPLAFAALLGGLVGATLAERRLSPRTMHRIFGVLVLVAAAKAAFDALAAR